jgi:pyruvate,water dikinase
VYWRDFIPFAHGARLFGQVYNDTVRPDDPFEFVELLTGSDTISRQRNQRLLGLAARVREDARLRRAAQRGDVDALAEGFRQELQVFAADFGRALDFAAPGSDSTGGLLRILGALADRAPDAGPAPAESSAEREARFLDAFPQAQRGHAAELLDLGRASYRLRDDDNIVLGRVERQYEAAIEELRQRLERRRGRDIACRDPEELAAAVADPSRPLPEAQAVPPAVADDTQVRARQLIGQPAGPGIVTGPAHVVADSSDIFDVAAGDVLVCDAIDPNMTFVVPLAGGIVERRGGMLIHGAIIAREYGLPCVTGVPEATRAIPQGATVTVDGYLGIVTVTRPQG